MIDGTYGCFTYDQVGVAVRDLHAAIAQDLTERPSGKSRKTIGAWKSVVAEALDRQKLSGRYYKMVIQEAVQRGLLRVERRGDRDYLVPVPPPELIEETVAGGPEVPVRSEEETRVIFQPAVELSVNPDPAKYRFCAVCGSSCPPDADVLYPDSQGVLCCNGCNDLQPPSIRL